MTTLREAAQQALEALEGKRFTACGWRSDCDKAITALRAALAEPPDSTKPVVESETASEPVQEPVAWSFEARHIDTAFGPAVSIRHPGREHKYMRNVKPLYAAPPQRKPLTEEEIDGLMQSIGLRCADDGNERMANHAEWERRQRRRIARAIERAHGIGGQP